MPFSPLFLFAFVFLFLLLLLLLPHREVQSGDSSAMMTRDEGKTSICFSLASETRKTKSASLKKKKKKKRTQTRRAMRIRSRAEWCFSYSSSTSMMMLRMKTSVFPPVLHRWYHAYAYHHRDRRRRLGERARGFVPFFSLLKLEDSSQ